MSTRVLLAPDKFKGTLSASEVARHLATGFARRGIDTIELPVADGGDGSVEAAVAAGFTAVRATVAGPTGEPHPAVLARSGDTAVVEVANTCGLALLSGRHAPLRAATHGVGDALRAALDAGVGRVVLALGGSASTDAGAGLLQSLGVVLRDASGRAIERIDGGQLADVASIDAASLPDLRGVRLVAATDVTNPLLGPAGAAAGYGAQKGASPDERARLEAGAANLVSRLAAAGRPDAHVLAAHPGAGAAGGLGFAALLLGARIVSGADFFLDLVGFDERLGECDVVVTGEGALDEQTLHGKLPVAIARRARGRPVLAVAGRCEIDAGQLRRAGFAAAHALTDRTDADPAGDPQLSARLLRDLGAGMALPLNGAP